MSSADISRSSATKIVFFGNERLATGITTTAPTLQSLIAAGYDVVAVVSHQTASRSGRDRQLEIAEVARAHDIPLLLPERPADILEDLQALQADIGILVAYGKIVPQSVIDIFPRGIINIHPSLLPLHRGPIPIESVILDGSTETGVSVMQLVRAMDAGSVYGQSRLALDGNESKQNLADKLLAMGGKLVLEILPAILAGSLHPAVQDDAQASYDALIAKADGLLDFTKPAEHLAREVRAYLGWPGSRTRVGDTDSIITAAHVVVPDAGEASSTGAAATKPGSLWLSSKQMGFYTSTGILVIDRLKPAGKPEMSAEAFLAGHADVFPSGTASR